MVSLVVTQQVTIRAYLLTFIFKFAADDDFYAGYEFYPDDVVDLGDDRYQLSMTHALPEGVSFLGNSYQFLRIVR